MIGLQKSPTAQSQIAKVSELLQTLQGQETSAIFAVEQSNEQLSQIQQGIADARLQLQELERKAELEAAEQQVSEAVKRLRALADRFNRKSAELAGLSREIVELDPHGKIIQGDCLNFQKMPVLLHSVGVGSLHSALVQDLPDWAKREIFSRQAKQLLDEFRG